MYWCKILHTKVMKADNPLKFSKSESRNILLLFVLFRINSFKGVSASWKQLECSFAPSCYFFKLQKPWDGGKKSKIFFSFFRYISCLIILVCRTDTIVQSLYRASLQSLWITQHSNHQKSTLSCFRAHVLLRNLPGNFDLLHISKVIHEQMLLASLLAAYFPLLGQISAWVNHLMQQNLKR